MTEQTKNTKEILPQRLVDSIEALEKIGDGIIPQCLTDSIEGIAAEIRAYNAEMGAIDQLGLGVLMTEGGINQLADKIDELTAQIKAYLSGVDTGQPPTTEDTADEIVKGFASILSAGECRQAERETPQPKIIEPDPTKARIIGMLTENTGCDILDSGGAHGRQWQQNRHIKNFDDIPACSIDVCADGRDDGEVTIAYNVYKYLSLFLSITEESERLNAILQKIVETSGNAAYPADVEMFLIVTKATKDGCGCGGANTYNYDNIISQVLQYDIFEIDGETYIALQIHGGCDIRGGYTKPQVFCLEEPDYFIMAQMDITAWCGCGSWLSDDAGYHWYFDGRAPSKPADWFYSREKNTVRCLDCRQPVTFMVITSV